MPSLSIYLALIKERLQDKDAALGDVELVSAFEQAKLEYSQRRPFQKLHEITGDGTAKVFNLPADWNPDWSYIVEIESPTGKSPRAILATSGYRVIRDLVATVTTVRLQFDTAPKSGDTARVLYTTGQHEDTIPTIHAEAVASLAAGIAAQWLANRYAQQTDTTLTVDIADRDARSREFASRASEMRGLYEKIVSVRTRRRLTVSRV